MRSTVDDAGAPGGRTPDHWRGSQREREPVSAITSELERIAADIDYWYRDGGAEQAAALQDALHAVHRTIVALREAQAVEALVGIPEHWFG